MYVHMLVPNPEESSIYPFSLFLLQSPFSFSDKYIKKTKGSNSASERKSREIFKLNNLRTHIVYLYMDCHLSNIYIKGPASKVCIYIYVLILLGGRCLHSTRSLVPESRGYACIVVPTLVVRPMRLFMC